MKEPLVSILMENYNYEKFVGKAIESVLNQTYTNWELIIVDDCSSDNSDKIIYKFAKDEPRIKYRRNKQNLGNITSRNDSLKLVKGSLVAFLDADDYWEYNKLQEQVCFMNNNTNIAGCFTWAKFVDENNKEYKNPKDLDVPLDFYNNNSLKKNQIIRRIFDKDNYLCNTSALIKLSAIKNVELFDDRFWQLQDCDFWIRILLKNSMFIINKPLTNVRRVKNNKTSITKQTTNTIIRHYNESMIVVYRLINGLSNKDLLKSFSDLLIRKPKNINDYKCEKFFLLLEWGRLHNNNFLPALMYIFNNYKSPSFKANLSKRYNFSVKDLYKLSSEVVKPYPITLYEEYNKLLQQYNRLSNELRGIYKSKSWKITKPFRWLKKFLKG